MEIRARRFRNRPLVFPARRFPRVRYPARESGPIMCWTRDVESLVAMTRDDRRDPMDGAILEQRLLGVVLPALDLAWIEDRFVSLAAMAAESALAIFFYRGVEDGSSEMDDEDARQLPSC